MAIVAWGAESAGSGRGVRAGTQNGAEDAGVSGAARVLAAEAASMAEAGSVGSRAVPNTKAAIRWIMNGSMCRIERNHWAAPETRPSAPAFEKS